MHGLMKIRPFHSSVVFRVDGFWVKVCLAFFCICARGHVNVLATMPLYEPCYEPCIASLSVVFIFLNAGRCWAHLCLLSGFLPHYCSLLLVQFEDSEEDFDSRFDTDDELSYRRDSVYSCVTLPYFHSFLYMKGMSCSHQGAWV